MRLALVTAPLVLIGGTAFAVGVGTGSARIAAPAVISPGEVADYHLSTFPADQAGAFGATYLMLCLTHPDLKDKGAAADRLVGLARMVSVGVAAGCGWDGTGPAQHPLTVIWDGTVTPTVAEYASGTVAQLGFLVTLTDGRISGIGIPIWVSDPVAGSPNMRVVGDLAVMPAARPAPAPTALVNGSIDGELSETLPAQVLIPFLRAWAASDPVQLNLVLTNDASAAARTGIGGDVSDPTILRTQVLTDKPSTSGKPRTYRDGDAVTALVSVGWVTRAAGSQRTGYVITLHRSAGRWQVADIAGAVPDQNGGAASGTTFTTAAG